MKNRIAAGLVAAALVAAAAPVMRAVADHSGSSRDSKLLAANGHARRGASATWLVKTATSTKRYTFGVWTSAYADAHLGTRERRLDSGEQGGSYAVLETCTTKCTVRKYRGESGAELQPSPLVTSSATFEQSPTLESASFTGLLVGSTSSCSFTVTWASIGDPRLSHRYATAPTGSSVPVGTTVVRSARATVTSDCWPTLRAGAGEIWRSADPTGTR